MNVSPEAKDDIQFEFSQILKEAELTKILIPLFTANRIDEIQVRAAATTLHSIYNGIEKIFVLILTDQEIKIPDGPKWHSELLTLITDRKIISKETYESVRDYQSFRHFFRHSYGFMLDQELLFPLINNALQTIEKIKSEILEGA